MPKVEVSSGLNDYQSSQPFMPSPSAMIILDMAQQAPPKPQGWDIRERIARGELIVGPTGAYSTPDIAQGRNLDSYSRLRPLDGGLDFRKNRQAFTEAREFLWTHWNEHLNAYLVFTVHTVDATTTWHIFVEPDETDQWCLVWRMVRDTGEVRDVGTFYSVENETGRDLKDRADAESASVNILVMKSSTGVVLAKF
jgi:hypothetical protein